MRLAEIMVPVKVLKETTVELRVNRWVSDDDTFGSVALQPLSLLDKMTAEVLAEKQDWLVTTFIIKGAEK